MEAFQHAIVPTAHAFKGVYAGDVSTDGSMERAVWQYRTARAAAFVATGDVHLAVSLLSLVVLLLSFCLRYIAKAFKLKHAALAGSRNASTQFIPIPFALAHLGASVTACSLGWLLRSWKRSVALSYIVLLGIALFGCKNDASRQRMYHHMNTMATVTLILAAVQDLIPMAIIGSKYRPSSLEAALLGSLAVTVAIAAATPRPRRPITEDAEEDESPVEETISPEETCSLFSYYCSYEWITHVILQGCRRDLTMADLPPLPEYDKPWKWLQKITAQRLKGGKTFRILCRLLKTEIKTMICWSAATAVVDYIAPYAMLRLLAYLENSQDAVVHPLVWIAALFVGPTLRSLSYQQYIFTATRLLVRLNISLVQELYRTALRSHIYDSSVDQSSKDTGKSGHANLTSLMSYDVDAIYNSRDIFFVGTGVPISVVIAMVFLYRMLGWPSLFGVLTLICLTPLPAMASRKVSRIQRSVMQATDARLSKISEYLNSIRSLKYFGWEQAALDQISETRAVEQRRLWRRSVYAAGITMAGDLVPFAGLLVMFSVLVLFTDRPLRAPLAFTSLSIMETLRSQFVWLSNVSRNSAQGSESLRRVDRFFESAEEVKRHPAGPLEFKNATFRRTPIAAFRLRDMSIRFQPNALNVVTGPTGSGKTSLLLSLLGETVLESGTAACPRDVAYVPQTAWLQNDTVRQNILFYSSYDETRYKTVVEASSLSQDLEQLAAGDLTVVGEKGTALSGGQKQRVSLARALYSRSSTLLLDDIFSALDTHTTSLVYERCFRSGLLGDRTVVLVTHFPAALQDATMVVSLKHGVVSSVRMPLDTTLASEGVVRPDSSPSGSEDEETQEENASPEDSGPLPVTKSHAREPAARITKETSATGRIPRTLFFQYMVLFGGYSYALLAILTTLTVQFAYFSITYWLSIWTGAYSEGKSPNTMFYLSVYATTIAVFLVLQLSNNLIYQYGGWAAAKRMHANLLRAVLFAPIPWFDANPIGRAINRFGNDTRSMDTVLIEWLRMSIENALRLLLRIASIASIMPVFALPAAIICMVGFVIGEMYTRAQISIKRLTSVNYSPVFSHFTDTLAGLTVIRARDGMDEVFQNLLAERLAVHSQSAEAQYNCNRWVSVRTDFCAASVAAAAGFVAYFKQTDSAGLVGFSLTNAIGMSQTILILVRTMNELEIELNSFQRMREYAAIEPEEKTMVAKENAEEEADLHPQHPLHLPASWPTSGRVEFHHVTARYQIDDGPDVLRDVSFSTQPGERIALVGRTGSGKSTLGLSLLRFVPIVAGQIIIDGVDISRIPLKRLRTSVTLIPQEPVLFSGDVHSNLDPFGECSDSELRSALAACASIQVHHHSHTAHDRHGQQRRTSASTDTTSANGTNTKTSSLALTTPVAVNGENFSQGQRQVLGLARALCRRSKVVLLDEATASVDQETDAHMQRLLREMFPDSTIIAIAHRLRTIMDYDRVLVMDGGVVVE